jgi:signal transduction histidine kinase/ActR/RegA family two-component response regulator
VCRSRGESGENNQPLKFWPKRSAIAEPAYGLALAALRDAPRTELLRAALAELRADGVADRIGIWMADCAQDNASDDSAGQHPDQRLGQRPDQRPRLDAPRATDRALQQTPWRGLVWDRESDSTPVEWEHLSAQVPLPSEVLLGTTVLEQEFPNAHAEILIGVFIGLRRALWVPIASRGHVHGVILCGASRSQRAFSRSVPLRVAAEFALQLGWREERRVARERHADLALVRKLHSDLQQSGQADPALSLLMDSIVAPASGGGLEAAFAAIGVLASSSCTSSADASVVSATGPNCTGVNATGAPSHQGTRPTEGSHLPLEFPWKSGAADWLRTAETGPLAEFCQSAFRARHAIGLQPEHSWLAGEVARVVAVPIESAGQLYGMLLAGLPHRSTSLVALERLERRAMLAALALEQLRRERQATLAARQQRAILSSTRESLLVLDEEFHIADLSTSAGELLARSLVVEGGNADTVAAAAGLPVARLFRDNEAEHQRLTEWLLRARDFAGHPAGHPEGNSARESWAAGEDALELSLRDGTLVLLRRALPSALGQTALSLEKIAGAPAAGAAEPPPALALQGVIEWLEEGVVMFDAHGRVCARNTRFEQFAGLGPSETAQGATLEELIAKMQFRADEPQQFAQRWRELARHSSEGGTRDEVRLLQPAPRILERASRPVVDAFGRQIGRVEIYRDLTARRVFQSQLLQTEKLAALGQMLTGVAHELSNPLTSILGYAQRLLLREGSAAHLPEVRQIFQEAERAGGILRQLLSNAREAPPERRRVPLNQVVRRSIELQQFSTAAEQIRFDLDLDPALPMVIGDAAQLQQVLMNLVGNARQAIQQEGRSGRIRVRTSQTAGRRVLLEVEDDGPGVPQSILARIFDPFFTTKAAGVGTGLGLSIVLSIVREHGGRVNVRRAPEGGAVFSVELPIAEAVDSRAEGLGDAPEFSGVAPGLVSGRVPADPLESRNGIRVGEERPTLAAPAVAAAARRAPAEARVLVVEDEPTVARLIADVLQDEGFSVDVLLDGREALERAAQKTFDLVICDMKMPGLDGQQFFQSLVASGNPLWRSFLFVTGDVIAPATHAFLERHHLAHLAKPFRVEELSARVKEVLQDSAHMTASAGSSPPAFGAARNVAGK